MPARLRHSLRQLKMINALCPMRPRCRVCVCTTREPLIVMTSLSSSVWPKAPKDDERLGEVSRESSLSARLKRVELLRAARTLTLDYRQTGERRRLCAAGVVHRRARVHWAIWCPLCSLLYNTTVGDPLTAMSPPAPVVRALAAHRRGEEVSDLEPVAPGGPTKPSILGDDAARSKPVPVVGLLGCVRAC